LPDAFADAALRVLAHALGRSAAALDGIEEREIREVRAHGVTRPALFAHFIDECLYVHDVEGFVWRRVDFAVFDAEPRAGGESMRLHAFLHGQTQPGEESGAALPGPFAASAIAIIAAGAGFEIAIDVPAG
jgi:SHS2 domain-containing protein